MENKNKMSVSGLKSSGDRSQTRFESHLRTLDEEGLDPGQPPISAEMISGPGHVKSSEEIHEQKEHSSLAEIPPSKPHVSQQSPEVNLASTLPNGHPQYSVHDINITPSQPTATTMHIETDIPLQETINRKTTNNPHIIFENEQKRTFDDSNTSSTDKKKSTIVSDAGFVPSGSSEVETETSVCQNEDRVGKAKGKEPGEVETSGREKACWRAREAETGVKGSGRPDSGRGSEEQGGPNEPGTESRKAQAGSGPVVTTADGQGQGEQAGQGATGAQGTGQPRPCPTVCCCVPLRHLLAVTLFLGMVIINAMRTNVAVTVLTILNRDRYRHGNDSMHITEVPSVDWDTRRIGYLHSIFYLGYMVTQLPAGYLTTRLPSHKLFGGCVLTSCMLNLTLPIAIELGGYYVTFAVRLAQGLSEGLLYPACYGILRHWTTPQERGRVGSLVLTGAYLGPVVGFPLSGAITDFMGWEYIYYVNGASGVLYVLLWAWLSEEKPAHHKEISADELCLIEDLQGSERLDFEGLRIPWRQILLSPPVASLCLCNFARNWVFVLMLTNEPFYLNMFHLSIAQNGAFSALPHVFKMLASLIGGLVADVLLARKVLSTTLMRKMLTSGFGVQALFFGLLIQCTDTTRAMLFLTLATGFGGFVVSGWQLNHYDLSARHASVLVAVTSTFGNIASVTVPIAVGILTEHKMFEGWDKVFIITSVITGTACLSFLVFGSGERQPWSLPPDTTSLVAKEDKRRRHGPSPSPSVSYCRRGEGHGLTTPVPSYGSHDTALLHTTDKAGRLE